LRRNVLSIETHSGNCEELQFLSEAELDRFKMIENSGGSTRPKENDDIDDESIKISSNSSSNSDTKTNTIDNGEINKSNEMEIADEGKQSSSIVTDTPIITSSTSANQSGNELEALLTSLLANPPPPLIVPNVNTSIPPPIVADVNTSIPPLTEASTLNASIPPLTNLSNPVIDTPTTTNTSSIEKIEFLIGLGFSNHQAANALIQSSGDVDLAATLLLASQN
jgi:hypothetical protein